MELTRYRGLSSIESRVPIRHLHASFFRSPSLRLYLAHLNRHRKFTGDCCAISAYSDLVVILLSNRLESVVLFLDSKWGSLVDNNCYDALVFGLCGIKRAVS